MSGLRLCDWTHLKTAQCHIHEFMECPKNNYLYIHICLTSNVRRDFLNLITKYFPDNSPLAKIFNKNNIRLCYRCTSNMSQIIIKKNAMKILHPSAVQHITPTNAIVESKIHAPNQESAHITTLYTKPQ